EEQGDMAGAWGWYNAALRASRHVGMRRGTHGRLIGHAMLMEAADRIVAWAGDPRVDAALLRRALADLRTAAAMGESASDTLKGDYANLLRAIAHHDRWMREVQGGYFPLPPPAFRALAFVKREPERSRRIAWIIFAHWLANGDRPRADRPPMSTDITLKV